VLITSDKRLKSPGAIWLQKNSFEGYQIDLVAGSKTVIADFPYEWVGDNLFGSGPIISDSLAVVAVNGVVTGNYIGGINVLEDDPAPKLTVVATNVTAKEGQSLKWQLRLSAPTTGFDFSCYLVPPRGTELNSRDVASSWLQSQFVTPPLTPTPLSRLNVFVQVRIPYGVRSASLIVPIARDGKAESKESIACEGYNFENGKILTLVGVVPQHN
jgi:hypothetical protein